MLVRETALVSLLLARGWAGLLGGGEGEGSCAAPPFRASQVQWAGGCPHWAPCCSEYGYCRPRVSYEVIYTDFAHILVVSFIVMKYFRRVCHKEPARDTQSLELIHYGIRVASMHRKALLGVFV